ncbi:hypothetical protein BJY01DRAFT_258445 [Aspergillus pseudoustus]|uniref:F-box domain-containing protein n=1 Tax=Aspergillus pseudoustus TaxID=1810923 RepID=A0ABR4JB05_9EURO
MPPVRRSKRLQPSQPAEAARQTRRRDSRTPTRAPLDRPKPARKKAASKQTFPQRSVSQTSTDPNESSRLFRIPRELLYEITAHLPPAGLACLTLTCKLALETLGTDSWAAFRGRARLYHSPEGSLCNLLARDLPGHEYCVRCETAHPPLKPPRGHRCTKYTQSCFGFEATIDSWPQTEHGGYSIVWPHIQQTFEARGADAVNSPPLELFEGDFSIRAGTVNYRLISSARWIDRNLVLEQEYRVSSAVTKGPLQAADVTSLPLRVCAHLTTATAPPKGQPAPRKAAQAVPNGPLLTHAITSAFPVSLRRNVPASKTFRAPRPSEETQMTEGEGDPGFIWRCRSCPTKFKVEYVSQSGGELVVRAWYSFGKEVYRAVDYWKWFVRRDHENLGRTKRNSEFYVPSRVVPNFAIE